MSLVDKRQIRQDILGTLQYHGFRGQLVQEWPGFMAHGLTAPALEELVKDDGLFAEFFIEVWRFFDQEVTLKEIIRLRHLDQRVLRTLAQAHEGQPNWLIATLILAFDKNQFLIDIMGTIPGWMPDSWRTGWEQVLADQENTEELLALSRSTEKFSSFFMTVARLECMPVENALTDSHWYLEMLDPEFGKLENYAEGSYPPFSMAASLLLKFGQAEQARVTSDNHVECQFGLLEQLQRIAEAHGLPRSEFRQSLRLGFVQECLPPGAWEKLQELAAELWPVDAPGVKDLAEAVEKYCLERQNRRNSAEASIIAKPECISSEIWDKMVAEIESLVQVCLIHDSPNIPPVT